MSPSKDQIRSLTRFEAKVREEANRLTLGGMDARQAWEIAANNVIERERNRDSGLLEAGNGMSALIISEVEADERAMRNAPPDERLPWVRREERQTPKPTADELAARWRKLMEAIK